MGRNDVTAMVDAAGRVLTNTWGPTDVELLDPIRTGWGRHDVILCNASGPAGRPSTVVVKAPVERRAALFSEWAVHEWLAGDARTAWCVPAFHGGDTALPLIVIGDVGAGPHLHRLLQVPGAATDAVASERELTAHVHATTRGRGAELAAVRARLPDGPAAAIPTVPTIHAEAVVAELARWQVPVDHRLVSEVERLARRLDVGDRDACLVFNDACPVNRIAASAGVVAIDLERAAFGHPAIDAAFPAIGHLACTTRIRPDEAIAWPAAARLAAEQTYRTAVAGAVPEWDGDAFTDDLAAATVVWLATVLGRVAERTMPDDRRSPSRDVARSRVLSVLDAALAVAARADGMRATARWAAAARDRCVARWPAATALAEVAGHATPANRS